MNNPIKIMLVEDHKLIRVGIRTLFDDSDDFDVVAESDCGKDAIEKALKHSPDVILLDIGLPDISGIKVIKALQDSECKSKIVILTSHNDEEEVQKTLAMGVFAYIIKDISTELLLPIIKTINDGAIWLDSKIVPILRNKSDKIIPPKQTTRAAFRNSHANLTQREYEVLKLVVEGKSNNDIAHELCISEHTAKAHVCNIIQKLVVDDRTQAAVKALKEGIV